MRLGISGSGCRACAMRLPCFGALAGTLKRTLDGLHGFTELTGAGEAGCVPHQILEGVVHSNFLVDVWGLEG